MSYTVNHWIMVKGCDSTARGTRPEGSGFGSPRPVAWAHEVATKIFPPEQVSPLLLSAINHMDYISVAPDDSGEGGDTSFDFDSRRAQFVASLIVGRVKLDHIVSWTIEEAVTSGVSTSKVDPLGVGDFMAPEREYIAKVADAIEEVLCRTERHDHGIVYSVVMVLAPSIPYDDQPDYDGGHEVWQRFVRFGATAGTQAGGHHFVVAAQDQEAIGAYVWRAMEAAQQPLDGPAETYPHDGGRY